MVGHLPHLERLTSLLLTGSPDRRPVVFRNGGVVCLEKDGSGVWSLLWAIVPDLLRDALKASRLMRGVLCFLCLFMAVCP